MTVGRLTLFTLLVQTPSLTESFVVGCGPVLMATGHRVPARDAMDTQPAAHDRWSFALSSSSSCSDERAILDADVPALFLRSDASIIASSVTKPQIDTAAVSIHWNQLVPKMWEHPEGVDVELIITAQQLQRRRQDPQQMACALLEKIEQHPRGLGVGSLTHRLELEQELSAYIERFTEYCNTSLLSQSWNTMTIRLASTRGAISTRCPKWHKDQLPFRWIQSLVGPGCQYLDPNLLDPSERHSFSLTACTSEKCADATCSIIGQAQQGEAVLLLGREWTERGAINTDLAGVFHKSPEGIRPWQGRVLLTMDCSAQ